MQEFQITLKNEKAPLYNRISWLIIIINLVLLLYLGIFSKEKNIKGSNITALVLFVLLLFYYFYFRKTIWAIGIHPFLFFLMLIWIKNEYYWLAALLFVFDILSMLTTRKTIAIFSEKNISYPSFPRKIINWKELNNTVIKDDLLTIDLKNNKLIQQMIDESKTSVNEKEFNEFCRQQLNK